MNNCKIYDNVSLKLYLQYYTIVSELYLWEWFFSCSIYKYYCSNGLYEIYYSYKCVLLYLCKWNIRQTSDFNYLPTLWQFKLCHPGLTRVSSIRFLLFEIKRVFVYNSTIFYLTDLFILYFFLQNAYADKKVFLKKD